MADQKRFNGAVGFNGQVDFTDDTQIKISGVAAHGPTGILYGRNETDKADPYQQGTTQLYPLGTELVYGGRHYRYAKLAGSGVTQGKLLQQAVSLTNTKDLSPTDATTAAGSKTLSVELGSSAAAIAANQFLDGFLVINDGDGQGFAYKIKSHPANADPSSEQTLVFTLYDAIQVAVTTGGSSKIDIVPNPYSQLIVAPTSDTGAVMGLTSLNMSANNFGWIQTKGAAAVLSQGAVVVGHAVARSASTAGAVAPLGADFVGDKPLGKVLHPNGNTDHSLIELDI